MVGNLKAEALLAVLPNLRARALTDLSLLAGRSVPSSTSAMLGRALFPRLCKLTLADKWLHLHCFLPLCTQLEELTLRPLPHDYGNLTLEKADLLACQLCGLPAPLQHLRIEAGAFFDDVFDIESSKEPLERLLQLAAAHVPHAALTLRLSDWFPPAASSLPWCSPRLQHLAISLGRRQQLHHFTAQLHRLGGVTQLELLYGPNPVYDLRGLETLSRLRCLQVWGNVPHQAWLCPGLTALRFLAVHEGEDDAEGLPLSAPPAVACTGLQRLQFKTCHFGGPLSGGGGALFSSLPQLTQLVFFACGMHSEEPFAGGLSRLSSLRQLAFDHTPLASDDLYEFWDMHKVLPSVTSLCLCGCKLGSLPLGPGASKLVSLDVSQNDFGTPLPFAVTVASKLRALALDFLPGMATEEGWEELCSHLTFLRRLEVLFLAVSGEQNPADMNPPQSAEQLAERLLSDRGIEVVLCEELSSHPVYGRQGWDPATL